MITEEIRSYEVSLWTLQDDFITVLKWSDAEQIGRIEKPQMKISTDGTQKLTFSIPMYYRLNGELVENPNWYDVENDNIMIGLRKLKVIFNKFDEDEDAEVYEFVITNVKETHEKDILTCDVEAEGLAFQELGKIGYKINLSQENFEQDYKEWQDNGKQGTEPIQSLKYWCEKIGLVEYPGDGEYINSRTWYYDIHMNWNAFENQSGHEREIKEIYEESYPTAWDDNLNPTTVESYRVKARAITTDKSNLYNITQDIAKQFGVFCRYEYKYDENYHIIGKVIVFYNNFYFEDERLGFQYPYSLSKVTRQIDNANVTTKLFILNPDENIVIENADCNPTKEDYILNFDYLYKMGAINQEQYKEIEPYNQNMRRLNNEIIQLQRNAAFYQTEIPELKAKQTIYKNSIDLSKEQEVQNNALLNKLDTVNDDEPDGKISLTAANADYCMLLTDENGARYVNLSKENQGIDPLSIEVYQTQYIGSNGALLDNKIGTFTVDKDTYGFATKVTFDSNSHLESSMADINWAKVFRKCYVPKDYKGNVDLSNRIIISKAVLASAGHTTSEEYETLFAKKYQLTDNNNSQTVDDDKVYNIIYTPIMEDGTVLTDAELTTYFTNIVTLGKNPQEWMAADKKDKGIFLHYLLRDGSVLSPDAEADTWIDNLHSLQKEWSQIRAAHNWFGYESNPSGINITPKTNGFSDEVQKYIDKYTTTITIDRVFLIYKYAPKLYYKAVIEMLQAKIAEDTANYVDVTKKLGPESDGDNGFDTSVYDMEATSSNIKNIYDNIGGYYRSLNDINSSLKAKIDEKNQAIRDFEHLMGPAIREGYWQPENYQDYGDKKSQEVPLIGTNIISDTGDTAIAAWDLKLFDEEEDIFYKTGIDQKKEYYPCINLHELFKSSTIPSNLSDYSLVWWANNNESAPKNNSSSKWNSIKDLTIFSIGSKALIRFLYWRKVEANQTIINFTPILLLVGAKNFSGEELERMIISGKARLEKCTISADGQISHEDCHSIVDSGNNIDAWMCFKTSTMLQPADWTEDLWTTYQINTNEINASIIYPRIKFSSLNVKTDVSNLLIKYDTSELSMFKDYRVNTRNTLRNGNYYPEYYITVKPESLIKYGYNSNKKFNIDYTISNGATLIYLDAKKISKENAKPKISYEVSVNALDIQLLKKLYNYLARVLMINDFELKFKDEFGYISSLDLDLDNPQNDRIEVKNYSTKFEDLFSTIVAQTEAMKQNSAEFNTALSGSIPLSEDGLMNTLNMQDTILQAYLDSHFDSSQVVKDRLYSIFADAALILADASKALASVRSLTLENASILAGFAQNVAAEVASKTYYSKTRPTDFKVGDVWVQVDDNNKVIGRYIATSSDEGSTASGTSGFVRTYDGTLASITGASLDIDADRGIINIEAANTINIKSGNNLYIAADERVDIVGNEEVNIGGTTINIGSASALNEEWGGINLVAASYADIDDALEDTENTTSKILINPKKIDMVAGELELRAASQLNFISSLGDTSNTSVVHISSSDGIWLGTGTQKGVRIFSGDVEVDKEDGTIVTAATGASVELNSEHLILGFMEVNKSRDAGTVIEMTRDYMVLAAGSSGTSQVTNNDTNNAKLEITGQAAGTTTTVNGNQTVSLVGAKFTNHSIGFATQSGSGNNIKYNAIIMNDNGITLGASKGGINLATATNEALRNYFSTTDNGSYVRVADDGIELGSMADLYINTDNFKLQTYSREKEVIGKEHIDGNTILAIGSGMQNISGNESIATLREYAERAQNPINIRLVVNKNGLYINGDIYAQNGYFKGTLQADAFYVKGTASSTSVGFNDYVKNNLINVNYIEDKLSATDYWKLLNGNFSGWDTGHNTAEQFWSGLQTRWNALDNGVASTITVQDLNTKAVNIINGEGGLAFNATGDNTYVNLDKKLGLVIIGAQINAQGDDHFGQYPFFRVSNNAMGFFTTETIPTKTTDNHLDDFPTVKDSLLYFENGNLAIKGHLYAQSGWFGGDKGWIISANEICSYSANNTPDVILQTKAANNSYTTSLLQLGSDSNNPALLFKNGSLQVAGTIKAIGGWLGDANNGWIIGADTITSGNKSYTIGRIQSINDTIVLSAGAKNGTTVIQQPYILMKDSDGTEVFKMQDGALEITGTIHASGGWFGADDGWIIGGEADAGETITTIGGTSFTVTGSRIQSYNNKIIINAGNNKTGNQKLEPYIIMRKSNNNTLENVFEYYNGNLSLKGNITATSLIIGSADVSNIDSYIDGRANAAITNTKIWLGVKNATEHSGMTITDTSIAFNSTGTFKVEAGTMIVDTTNFVVKSAASNAQLLFHVGVRESQIPEFDDSTAYDRYTYVKITSNNNATYYQLTADHAVGTTWVDTSKAEVSILPYISFKVSEGIVISSKNFTIDRSGNVSMTGTVNASGGYIGPWKIASTYIANNSTLNSANVGMRYDANDNSNKVAFFAGAPGSGNNTNLTNAKFRVTTNGKVYLNQLMVKDTVTSGKWVITGKTAQADDDHENVTGSGSQMTGYTPIDFSSLNFKNAITLSLTCNSSGTIRAYAQLWGKFGVDDTQSASAQIDTGVVAVAYPGATASALGYINGKIKLTVCGTTFTNDFTSAGCNVDPVWTAGWNQALSFVNHANVNVSDKKVVGLPNESVGSSDGEIDVSSVYDAGRAAGYKEGWNDFYDHCNGAWYTDDDGDSQWRYTIPSKK